MQTPDITKEAWAWKSNEPRRHAHLLCRRLPIELAIHLGELQTVADILGRALTHDMFTEGGSLKDFLMVPGIFDVLPLLARGGKESNPFFIPKQDAVGMVREITAVLELRAKHGRHRELHPTKVGWRESLNRLAEGVWHLHHEEYQEMGIKSANDLLYEPATEEEITAAEKKVGELPADFKEMVRVANGFKSRPDFFEGGIPTIQDITIKEGDNGYLRYELGDYKLIQLKLGIRYNEAYHFILPPRDWKKRKVRAGKEVKDGEYQYGYRERKRGPVDYSCWDSVWDFVCDYVKGVEVKGR